MFRVRKGIRYKKKKKDCSWDCIGYNIAYLVRGTDF